MKKLAFLALTLTVAASSFAKSDSLTFKGVDLAEVVHLSGALNADVYAGRLDFKLDGDKGGFVKSYCVDLLHEIHAGQTYSVCISNSKNQASCLRAAGNIIANGYAEANTASKAAGLQLAVWEAIYDGGSKADFSHGKVRADASAQTLDYANHFYEYRTKEGNARYFKAGCTGQSQMDAVPEPASIAALVIGGLGLLRRRNKKS